MRRAIEAIAKSWPVFPIPMIASLRYSTFMENPEDHPDLRHLGDALQRRLDRILETEQEAAAALARRTTGFRDRLIDAEDAGEPVTVTTNAGISIEGRLEAVCPDHIELRTTRRTALVMMDQIAVVELT